MALAAMEVKLLPHPAVPDQGAYIYTGEGGKIYNGQRPEFDL